MSFFRPVALTAARNSLSSHALIAVRSNFVQVRDLSQRGDGRLQRVELHVHGRKHYRQAEDFADPGHTDYVVREELTVHGGDVGELRRLVVDDDQSGVLRRQQMVIYLISYRKTCHDLACPRGVSD